MKIHDLKIRKALTSFAIVGTMAATAFTGCSNHQIVTINRTYNKAIIFDYENRTALIINVKSWREQSSGVYQIETDEDLWIMCSLTDTKLFNDEDTNVNIEDIAYALLGSDAKISYLKEPGKVRTK